MKAISIQQPWAWAILNSGKNIENRTWKTDYRGEILIRAGKKIDWESIEFLEYEYSVLIKPEMLIAGAIIGSVEIVDCVTTSNSKWFTGPYGFVLKNPIQFEKIIPWRGQLGIFNVNIDV